MVTQNWSQSVLPYLGVAALLVLLLNGLGIAKVRKWNPSRDIRTGQLQSSEHSDSQSHVDDRSRQASQTSRRVWDNPVLWRETCTWAYGKKILFIRGAYWLLAAGVAFWLFSLAQSGGLGIPDTDDAIRLAPAVRPLAPFVLVSMVLLNALAVSAITNERDGRSLDLLWMTDLSPSEFLFGKLGGVLLISADVILLPLLMFCFLFFQGSISVENMLYLVIGLAVLVVFIAVLGLHCGMIYANSQQAIGVSLGTVFFLFLGVITSMVMMVSFTGNVEAQLPPFIACIVGGSLGLYSALGLRNRSPAIGLASAVLPISMFVAITSFLLGHYMTVFMVVSFAYGFSVLAMMVPALSEFHFAMAKVRSPEQE